MYRKMMLCIITVVLTVLVFGSCSAPGSNADERLAKALGTLPAGARGRPADPVKQIGAGRASTDFFEAVNTMWATGTETVYPAAHLHFNADWPAPAGWYWTMNFWVYSELDGWHETTLQNWGSWYNLNSAAAVDVFKQEDGQWIIGYVDVWLDRDDGSGYYEYQGCAYSNWIWIPDSHFVGPGYP